MKGVLIAEHDGHSLTAATRSCMAAAAVWGGDWEVLVLGGVDAVAQEASRWEKAQRVLHATNVELNTGLAEYLSQVIHQQVPHYTRVMAPANAFGKNVLPRVAALSGVPLISDVVEITDEHTFVRPIYAGNALATVRCAHPPLMITVRPSAFEAVSLGEASVASVTSFSAELKPARIEFIQCQQPQQERPDLSSAKIVVSGGRALQSAENFKIIEALADALGAAVGASRAAVDAGYISNDHQVGQTGKVVAPQLYIAVGISGAIQHLAGMKDSKVIVAINKDEQAPIFQVADIGLVADLFEVVPELITLLNQ